MALNRLSPQEVQPVHDGPIVSISFLHIHMAGSQVCSDETEAGVVVVKSDANSAFVTRHAAQTGLSSGKWQARVLQRTLGEPCI